MNDVHKYESCTKCPKKGLLSIITLVKITKYVNKKIKMSNNTVTDTKDTANEFNKFFRSSGQRLASKIQTTISDNTCWGITITKIANQFA